MHHSEPQSKATETGLELGALQSRPRPNLGDSGYDRLSDGVATTPGIIIPNAFNVCSHVTMSPPASLHFTSKVTPRASSKSSFLVHTIWEGNVAVWGLKGHQLKNEHKEKK